MKRFAVSGSAELHADQHKQEHISIANEVIGQRWDASVTRE